MSESSFPNELLKKSKIERYEYFREYEIKHPILNKVSKEIFRAIESPKPGRLISIFGPTGVGKTTLIRSIYKQLCKDHLAEMKTDKNFIPIVCVEAQMPTVGNFSWNDFFRDIIEQLNEAGINLTPSNSANELDKERKELFRLFGNNSTSKTRFVFEKSLRYRRSKAIIIDEAQHITILSSGRKLLHQPNTIKSVANRTETICILFGGYDLLLLRDLNGQLSRRTDDIHFRRYDYTNENDVQSFKKIIKVFQNNIPTKTAPNLLPHWEYLYERSIGCIGILKEWLDRAVKLMLDEDDDFKIDYLEKTALSESKCITIANEIIAAENEILEKSSLKDDLKSILMANKTKKKNDEQQLDEGEPEKDPKKTLKNPRRVGVRNPKRDPVGGLNNG